MQKIGMFLADSIKGVFGHPAALERALLEHGDISLDLTPKQDVDATNVIRWHELGENAHPHRRARGWVMGWHRNGSIWESYDHHSSNLESIMVEDSEDHWGCDIRVVEALSASKSELKDYPTLDAFAEGSCKIFIQDETDEGLAKNLNWSEIRIIHREKTSDHFRHYAWDGRVLLINSGGSHHFIAARYIAGKLGVPVPLTGRLSEFNLSHKAVQGLCEEFDMYPIKNCSHLFGDMMDALRSFDAAFCLMKLPRPFSDSRVFMLPKDEPRSVQASKFLAKAGLLELGAHLQELCNKQKFIL